VSEMDRGKVGAESGAVKGGRRNRGKVGGKRSECWRGGGKL
jgi:hypothetical protein